MLIEWFRVGGLGPTSTPQLPSIIPYIPRTEDLKDSIKKHLGGSW